MKTTSLESLKKAMQTAEGRWSVDEAKESDIPLDRDGIIALRRGEKITVLTQFPSGARRVARATVTRVRPHGYTDMNGFWSSQPRTPKNAKHALRVLGLHRELPDALMPAYVVCFKTTDGYSDRYELTSIGRVLLYRGWTVNP